MLGGSPFDVLRVRPPPPLPCMPCAGSARCSGGSPSSSSWIGESPSPRSGMPCAGSARFHLGGSPSLSWSSPRAVGACSIYPASSCLRAVCAHCWVWRAPSLASLSWARPGRAGVSCASVIGGPPSSPRCAPWARAAGWGVPPPPPPRWLLTVGVYSRSGGALVSVHPPSGSCAMSARWEPHSGLLYLSLGGGSCAAVFAPPRALDVRHGCALMGEGYLSPLPPLAEACVRRARQFRGSPPFRLSSVGVLRQACALGIFVPPLLQNPSRAVVRGPMTVVSCCSPRSVRTSL